MWVCFGSSQTSTQRSERILRLIQSDVDLILSTLTPHSPHVQTLICYKLIWSRIRMNYPWSCWRNWTESWSVFRPQLWTVCLNQSPFIFLVFLFSSAQIFRWWWRWWWFCRQKDQIVRFVSPSVCVYCTVCVCVCFVLYVCVGVCVCVFLLLSFSGGRNKNNLIGQVSVKINDSVS